jgi:hypothetical protein
MPPSTNAPIAVTAAAAVKARTIRSPTDRPGVGTVAGSVLRYTSRPTRTAAAKKKIMPGEIVADTP